MIQAFLNRPEDPNSPLMSRAVLANVLRLAGIDSIARVNLIADWSRPPDCLPWALERMQKDRTRCTISFRPQDPREPIEMAARSGCQLALNLEDRGAPEPPAWQNELPSIEVFIPLASPVAKLSAFTPALDKLARIDRIVLGVGWRSWLSGPMPLSRDQKTELTGAALEFIGELTERELTAELACGMELCLFSRKQLAELATRRVRWPIGSCPTPLTIQPDGRVDCCHRLRRPAPFLLPDDGSLDSLSRRCLEWLTPLRGLCNLEMTADCVSLGTRACAGGCLEHYLADWHSATGNAFSRSSSEPV